MQQEEPALGQSENCLFANVFTSRECLAKSAGCPVVYYVYGGAWTAGDTEKFGDASFINQFVARVSFDDGDDDNDADDE